MVLKPWDERKQDRQHSCSRSCSRMSPRSPARSVVAFQPPSLPGAHGLPVQFVINTTDAFEPPERGRAAVPAGSASRAACSSSSTPISRSTSRNRLSMIDRDKAAQLGLKMSDVGTALASMLGGGYVNYFSLDGRSYKVIPQVQQRSRLNTDQLLNYYIRTADGSSVPLSTIATHQHQDDAGIAQPLPAAQQRDHPGRGDARASRRATRSNYLQGSRGAHAAAGLLGRLRRPVAPVRAGIERLRRDLRLRADHHLPVAGGAVRELPRSADHPGLGADVDRRRADLHRALGHRRRQRSTSTPRSGW